MQLTSSTWGEGGGESWFLQNNSRICVRMLSIALEEELSVLDFVLWLSYYYCVLFDYFPLCSSNY